MRLAVAGAAGEHDRHRREVRPAREVEVDVARLALEVLEAQPVVAAFGPGAGGKQRIEKVRTEAKQYFVNAI
jgi:hypothetical protein